MRYEEWELRGMRGRMLRRARAGKSMVPNPFRMIEKRWKPHHMCYVSAYHVVLAYGGPEEGGWWYQAGALLETVRVRYSRAEEVRERMRERFAEFDDPQPLHNVNSAGKLVIEISERMGASYPGVRPHYE